MPGRSAVAWSAPLRSHTCTMRGARFSSSRLTASALGAHGPGTMGCGVLTTLVTRNWPSPRHEMLPRSVELRREMSVRTGGTDELNESDARHRLGDRRLV